MKIYKVLPDLKKERHLKIWHRALRSQWSATDLKWDTPQRITQRHLKDQMGRILTPVLMGEQAALYSVSGLIPILGKMSEVESQFYLTTWAVDEARHTELFAMYYGRLDREPMSIRRFPAGYLFQSQIVSDEPGRVAVRGAGERGDRQEVDGGIPPARPRPAAERHCRRHPARRSASPGFQPHLPGRSLRRPLPAFGGESSGILRPVAHPSGQSLRPPEADARRARHRARRGRHRPHRAISTRSGRSRAGGSTNRSLPAAVWPRAR